MTPIGRRWDSSSSRGRRSGRAAVLPLVLLTAAGCSMVGGADEEFGAEGGPPAAIAPEELARRTISARDVRRDIGFLAADERRGRGSPDAGLERSAAWIADELYRAGIEPAGGGGGFLQYWPGGEAAAEGGEFAAGGEESATAPDPSGERWANVAGLVQGANLARAGEYVVLIAHYDHLGVGEPDEAGDSIYNGADDNASGVAALVAVARAFGTLPAPPARPVLFLAVSGSERGLLGSNWFARNPTVSLAEAVAVLNVDMVGRNHPDSIGVVGYGHSTLGPLIDEIASGTPELGLAVTRDPDAGADPFQRSDHFPFARRGIPAVQFFSGFHEDHRTPSDEADRVDVDKVARVARLVFLTAHRLATGGVEPEWTESGSAVIRR